MSGDANDASEQDVADLDYADQADFRYALRRFFRYSELQARKNGITPQQHLLLLMVRGHPKYPGVTIGDIAERLQVRPHTASLLVDRTLKRGLITRESDGRDRRRALVALTSEGDRLLGLITEANRRELGSLEPLLFRSTFIKTLQRR